MRPQNHQSSAHLRGSTVDLLGGSSRRHCDPRRIGRLSDDTVDLEPQLVLRLGQTRATMTTTASRQAVKDVQFCPDRPSQRSTGSNCGLSLYGQVGGDKQCLYWCH